MFRSEADLPPGAITPEAALGDVALQRSPRNLKLRGEIIKRQKWFARDVGRRRGRPAEAARAHSAPSVDDGDGAPRCWIRDS